MMMIDDDDDDDDNDDDDNDDHKTWHSFADCAMPSTKVPPW